MEDLIRELEILAVWHKHHYDKFHDECAETIYKAIECLKQKEVRA